MLLLLLLIKLSKGIVQENYLSPERLLNSTRNLNATRQHFKRKKILFNNANTHANKRVRLSLLIR